MKIAGITITHHSLPLDPPYLASFDTRPKTSYGTTLVRVTTDEGLPASGRVTRCAASRGTRVCSSGGPPWALAPLPGPQQPPLLLCLLYTSDAADDLLC